MVSRQQSDSYSRGSFADQFSHVLRNSWSARWAVAISPRLEQPETLAVPVNEGFLLTMTKADRQSFFFFFQAEDGIRALYVTGVQKCALPILVITAGIARKPGMSRDDLLGTNA